jgi:hypothetical protein
MGMIGPLWGEADEAKRIEGWKAVDRFVADNALVIPLLQFVQPILSAPGVVVTPHSSGAGSDRRRRSASCSRWSRRCRPPRRFRRDET